MPMLLSSACHEGCVVHGIKSYLESKRGKAHGRALAWDYLNLSKNERKIGWDITMDETRSSYGHDVLRRRAEGLKCRHYYHFVISPDPRDSKTIDDLRELTVRWAQEMFGGVYGSGQLGTYQVAICYHDDNVNHTPHAHLIVNCTNFDDGKKLNIDKRLSEHVMPDRLQEIAKEMGYSHFDNSPEGRIRRERSTRESNLTKFELGLQREMKWSWKQEMRDKINIAKLLTNDTAEFVEYMDKIGVSVRNSKNNRDWVFSDNRNERWTCHGEALGAPYRRDRIDSYLSSLRGKLFTSKKNRANAAERAAEWINEAQTGTRKVYDLADVLQCTKMLKIHNIEVYADFKVAYGKIAVDRAVAGYTRANTNNPYYEEMLQLQEAEKLAREMRLLDSAMPRISEEKKEELRKIVQETAKKAKALQEEYERQHASIVPQRQPHQEADRAVEEERSSKKKRAAQQPRSGDERRTGKTI